MSELSDTQSRLRDCKVRRRREERRAEELSARVEELRRLLKQSGQQIEQLQTEKQQLLARIDEAVSVIETWHGPEAWDIYYTHSPEMQRVNGVVDIVNPEGG